MWQNIIAGVIIAAVVVATIRWIVRRVRRNDNCTNCDSCPHCAERKRKRENKMKLPY